MSEIKRPDSIDRDDAEDAQPSEGPSGFGDPEPAGGGADAVPGTPDNVPADGSEGPVQHRPAKET
jgi:hypothetical protein